ncbi:MAG: hypothetical protein H7222_17510 [Methylotenera sp.]|nr:hypothetical protein [Oligoflexia bacterium]
MSEFEIVLLKTGINSLRSLEHGETFHPVTGPRMEANILHVRQQRLVERCEATPASNKFVIWDIGFGAGANVLAAIEALAELSKRDETQNACEIEIHSFDKTTSPIEFALEHQDELEYLSEHEAGLRELLSSGHVPLGPRASWQLHLGDFRELLRENLKVKQWPAPHAILYDPYSPTGNPEMWTLEHFQALRQALSPETPCLLTNYTRSTAMRVTWLLAGFHVGIGCEVGEKAETTIVTNQLALLERPLEKKWLERVRISGNSAPLRADAYSKGQISPEDFGALLECPQFQ